MELTSENLDYPDCRPVRADAEISVQYQTADWMQRLIEERKAKLARKRATNRNLGRLGKSTPLSAPPG